MTGDMELDAAIAVGIANSEPQHSCRWCENNSDFGGHKAFITTLEANAAAQQARIHELEWKLKELTGRDQRLLDEVHELRTTVQAYEDLLDRPSILDRIESRETIAKLEAENTALKVALDDR